MSITKERLAPALPEDDLAFHVEQHGTDFIPESERLTAPRAVGLMWAGASVQIEYTFSLPHGLNLVPYHTRDSFGYVADFSIYLGLAVGAVVYVVLARSNVQTETRRQDELLAELEVLTNS